MIKPDDDFDDDFEDGDTDQEVEDVVSLETKPNEKQHDTRKKIEEILEKRRLREEFGELDFE